MFHDSLLGAQSDWRQNDLRQDPLGESNGQPSFCHSSNWNMSESAETEKNHVILFDGVCNLCNGFVHFFVKRDPLKNLCFAPLQSKTGQRILAESGLPVDNLGSIVFVEDGHTHLNSTAVLRACKYLRFPWPTMKILLLIPSFLRNWIYRWIAKNRYRWFGKLEDCPLPQPNDTDRFI
tara:strand:+ start:301 stop:834 length:534 start_codon:yes stop_codon:yes gene_type:complete